MSPLKRIVVSLLPVIALVYLPGCSSLDSVGGSSEYIPTTRSIIPLQINNQWTYHYTQYDSTGNPVAFPDRDFDLEISGIFRLEKDTILVPVDRYSTDNKSDERYYYRYETEHRNSGYIVFHVGTGEVGGRGLYIAGTFKDTINTLFDSAKLWFAYPCDSARNWTIDFTGNDIVETVMECVSKNYTAWFYADGGSGPSPVEVVTGCYLYRETTGDDTFYHCFHPDYGKVSIRHYYKGVLLETQLLASKSIVL